jgi:hypothetical protein
MIIYYTVRQADTVPTLAGGTNLATMTGQASIALPLTSNTGIQNTLAKWITSTTLGSSRVYETATGLGIDQPNPSPSYKLDVNGNVNLSGYLMPGDPQSFNGTTDQGCTPVGAITVGRFSNGPALCNANGKWQPIGGPSVNVNNLGTKTRNYGPVVNTSSFPKTIMVSGGYTSSKNMCALTGYINGAMVVQNVNFAQAAGDHICSITMTVPSQINYMVFSVMNNWQTGAQEDGTFTVVESQ